MDCKFVVGQQVVCIRDEWGISKNGKSLPSEFTPIKGHVYEVSGIHVVNYVSGGVCLSLKGFPRHYKFCHWFFGPVATPSTEREVEKLKRLLEPSKTECPRKLEVV